MVEAVFSIDDFDWSAPSSDQATVDAPRETPAQAPPPEAPTPRPGRRSYKRDPYPELSAPAYRDYERPKPAAPLQGTTFSIDDFDYGAGPMTTGPAYQPSKDWAIERGFKVGRESGVESITTLADIGRIMALPKEQRAAEMIKLGQTQAEPGAARMTVEGIQDIGGVGEFFTWLGENAGQMFGSMAAAVQTGGLTGAAVGAGLGTVLPGGGTIAGGIAGFGRGTMASFYGMGIGGVYKELLQDKGVQQALADGTLTPEEVEAYAVGGGLVTGFLDTIAPKGLLKTAKGENIVTGKLRQDIRKALVKGATKSALQEGGTEGLQGAISEIGQAALGGNVDLGERALSVINQALAGAIGGATPGAAAGYLENARLPPPPANKSNPANPAGMNAPNPATTPHTGPTGNANIQAPPAGARPPAATRDAGKVPTPVSAVNVDVLGNNDVSPDLAAATGRTEEEEIDEDILPTDVAPAGVRRSAPAPAAGTGDATIDAALAAGKGKTAPAAEAPAPPVVEQSAGAAPTVEQPLANAPAVIEQTPEPSLQAAEPAAPPSAVVQPQTLQAPIANEPAAQPIVPAEPAVDETVRQRFDRIAAEPEVDKPLAETPQVLTQEPAVQERVAPKAADIKERAKRKKQTETYARRANKIIEAAARAFAEVEAADKSRVKPLQPLPRKPTKAFLLKRKAALAKYEAREKAYQEARDTYAAAATARWTTLNELRQRLTEDQEGLLLAALSPETRSELEMLRKPPEPLPAPERAPPARVEPEDRETTRVLKEGPQEFPQAQQRPPLPEVPAPAEKTVRMTAADYQRAVTGRGEEAVHQMLATRSTVRRGKRRLGRIDAVSRNEKTGELEAKLSWRSKLIPLAELLKKYSVEIGGVRVAEGVAPAAAEAEPTAAAVSPQPAPAAEPEPKPLLPKRKGWQKPGLRKFKEVQEEEAPPAGRKVKPLAHVDKERLLARFKAGTSLGTVSTEEVTHVSGKPRKVQVVIRKAKAISEKNKIPQKVSGSRFKEKGKPQPVTEQLRQVLRAELSQEVAPVPARPSVTRVPDTPQVRAAKKAEAIALQALDLETLAKHVAGQEALTAEQQAMTPGELASDRLVAAIGKARQLVEKATITLEQARRYLVDIAHGEAMRLWKENRAAERTGKHKGKSWKAIDREDYSTTFRNARAAGRRARQGTKGLDPHLLRIDELLDRLAALKDEPGTEATKARIDAEIAAEQKKRVEAAKLYDSEEARREAQLSKEQEKELKTLNKLIDEQFEAGEFDEDTRDLLKLDVRAGRKYKEKAERSKKTTPVIRTILAETNMPSDRGKSEQQYIGELKKWAADLLRRINAKADLPEKLNRFFNTPDENALIYIRNKAGARRWMRLKKGATEQEAREQDVSSPYDIWLAADLLRQRLRKPGETTKEYTQRANRAGRDISGLLFEATPDSQRRGTQGEQYYGTEAQQEELAAQRRGELNLDEILNQPREGGREEGATGQFAPDVQAKIDRAKKELGLASPREAGVSESTSYEPIETTTVGKAIDKYMRRLDDRTGAPRGWRRLMRRALMKSLKTLIGDMPVHFVNSSVIFNHLGHNAAGAFIGGKNPRILLHEATMARPALLAETLMHEMIHGGTAYALEHNLRGTRDIVSRMMSELKKQLGSIENLPEGASYAFRGPEEFVAQGLNDADTVDMLASLRVPASIRAQIRALGRGRDMPTWWDVFVAVIENAIGMFTPGRAGTSYLDQLLKLYPNVVMSHSEQVRDANLRIKPGEDANKILAAPFDPAAMVAEMRDNFERARVDKTQAGRNLANILTLSTEDMRKRVSDYAFGGNIRNMFSDYVDAFEWGQRDVADEMARGDQLLDDIRRWQLEDPSARTDEVAAIHKTASNASIDKVDPRKSLADNKHIRDDALHPTIKPRQTPTWKHRRDQFMRAMWQRYHDEWAQHPQALRDKLSKLIDHMKSQMLKYETKLVTNWVRALEGKKKSPLVLPSGMSRDQAVQEIMSGKVSSDLKTALGKNAETIKEFGRLGLRNLMYMPSYRNGKYFISGRRDIATPTPSAGTVAFDQHAYDDRGIFRFVFDNEDAAHAYAHEIATEGEERVLNVQRVWMDPVTHKPTTQQQMAATEEGTELFPAYPLFYVTLQDRFMTMGDSIAELNELADQLRAEGMKDVSSARLTDEARNAGTDHFAPIALQRMLHNIDGMDGISENEKALIRTMATASFVQNQQGARITKRMLNRKGVLGQSTTADDLYNSLRTHNEMIARHIVSSDRVPALAKAEERLRDYIDALSKRQTLGQKDYDKFSAEEQAMLQRGYGKDDATVAARLGEDVKEIGKRINAMMGAEGGPYFGERVVNAIMQAAVMNYLAKPAYFVVQLLSFPMLTFPNMVREMGWGAAFRYARAGWAALSKMNAAQRAAKEFLEEGKQFAKGFAPRQGYFSQGRALRRPADIVELMKAELNIPSKYSAAVNMAIDDARRKNFLGQAGLDQLNLRMDLQKPGVGQKILRGIQQSTRMFSALQEPIEGLNRVGPLIGWVQYYKDIGMSDEQAAARAVNNMTREQVGYSRANKPRWMSYPALAPIAMFKMFGLQYAVQFWGSMYKSLALDSDPQMRKEAMRHLVAMTAMLAVFGGFSGNPLWEPIKYLMMLFGYHWDDMKTEGEKMMASLTGETAAEVAMYGPARLFGLDLSSRVSMDNLLTYQLPKEMTQEGFSAALGNIVLGAPGGMLWDTGSAVHELVAGSQSWSKWASTLPLPGMVKDIFKAADLYQQGPTTATGVSTGDPGSAVAAALQAAGLRSREQARPFEQGSAAKQRMKERAADEKAAITRAVLNQGMTARNMAKIRAYNVDNPDSKITIKSISEARKRRRRTEKEIRRENVE